jgi:hypothetical protein
MIGKKALVKLQRRLLRARGARHSDPDKAGLTASDYDMLCKANDTQHLRRAAKTKSGRALILK